jgi:transmembrane sensor
VRNEIEINDELIARYLGGEASPEEAMALHNWLQTPANRQHFDDMQRVWVSSFPARAPREVNVKGAWNTLISTAKGPQNRRRYSRNFGGNLFKAAASILLIASVAWLIYYIFRNDKSVELVAESRDSLRQIIFSDHSEAMLNRGSTLEYPENFDDRREVYLMDGEAFFKVEVDETKPFVIRTQLATIEVLGTAFNVMIDKKSLEVSVDHGKVLVYTVTDSVMLQAGGAASVMKGETTFVLREANSNTWSYATHKFVFKDTPIREVFNYIQKAQNCSIALADPDIGNCKLSATFESVSTDYMLTLITEALNLSVTKNDDRTFTVEGEGCH